MRIELYTALLAVIRGGMTAMFIDPSAGPAAVDASCRLHPPRAFWGSPAAHLLRLRLPAVREPAIRFHTGPLPLPGSRRWHLAPGSHHEEAASVPPEAPALITFTSGSTGQPKAVARSHAFLVAQHAVLAPAIGLSPGAVELVTLPVFVLANLASGVTSVIADTDLRRPAAADPAAIGRQIREETIGGAVASPSFFHALLARPESLAPLRRIHTGGAPVFPPLLDRLADASPDARITAVYGSTEAEPIAELPREAITGPDREAMRAGHGLLAGRPVDAVDLAILPDRWGRPLDPYCDRVALDDALLGPGQPGEIVVGGPHVLPGYLHGLGDEETKVRVGDTVWHRTGDAGYLDDRGRLWLLGRCAARLSSPADAPPGSAYPLALECALSFEPDITRSALLEHRGRRVLVLEIRPGRSFEELAARLAPLIERGGIDRALPCRHIPVDRRHQAKTDYPRLRRWLERVG